MIINGNNLTPNAKGSLLYPDGNYLLPGMSFVGDPTSGWSRDADGNIVASVKGKIVGKFDENGFSNEIPGSVLEQLWSPCDGSSYQLTTGTYSIQNVISTQTLSNAFTDITGSVISYRPPPQATTVVYRFSYSNFWSTAGLGITHHTFWIGGNEVVFARHGRSNNSNQEHRYTFEWAIKIGGSSNKNTGRLSSWNSPLDMRMRARNLNTGLNDGRLHGTAYWTATDGMQGSSSTRASQLSIPVINIIALR